MHRCDCARTHVVSVIRSLPMLCPTSNPHINSLFALLSVCAPFQFSGMRAGERAPIELKDQASGKRVLLATNVHRRGGGAGGPSREEVQQESTRLSLRVTFVSPPKS